MDVLRRTWLFPLESLACSETTCGTPAVREPVEGAIEKVEKAALVVSAGREATGR